MTKKTERERLIEEDSVVVSFPPPDYSKMTNEEIALRTYIIRETFKMAFSEDDEEEEDDDI